MVSPSIPWLGVIAKQYNEACAAYHSAADRMADSDFRGYEDALRSAAKDGINALELALKIYLRAKVQHRMTEPDRKKLENPNFPTLLDLMQEYAEPPLTPEEANALREHRRLRNATEHDSVVPLYQEVSAALQRTCRIMVTYLQIAEEDLSTPDLFLRPEQRIQNLKQQYLDWQLSLCEYVDFSGISPRASTEIVKIRIDELFIPPRFKRLQNISEWSDPAHTVLSICDLLQEHKIIILGHPGTGKTTIGRYLAVKVASGDGGALCEDMQDKVPIMARAAEYAAALKVDPAISFYDFILQRLTIRFDKLLEWVLHSGIGIVVIDGLDEITDPALRAEALRNITRFVSEFHSNRFLITSRYIGYAQSQLDINFAHFGLLELDENQIVNYLEKWHQAVRDDSTSLLEDGIAQQQAHDLWNMIRLRTGLAKIAANPLLLTIIALINWRGKGLPNKRVEVYQIAAETLLMTWPLEHRGKSIAPEEVLSILEPIACWMTASDADNLITEYDLRAKLESEIAAQWAMSPVEARKTTNVFLETIGTDTGFFVQKGYDSHSQSLYGFLHRTFMEYLAARYLARKWLAGELDLHDYAHHDRWHEALLLMAGYVDIRAIDRSTSLVRSILELGSLYEEHLHRDLLLAAEMLENGVEVNRELADSIVSRLVAVALNTPHAEIWERVVDRLSRRQPTWWEVLLRPAKGDDRQTRLRKAVLLAQAGCEVSDDDFRLLLWGMARPSDSLDSQIVKSLDFTDAYDELLGAGLPIVRVLLSTPNHGSCLEVGRLSADRIASLGIPFCDAISLTEAPPVIPDAELSAMVLDFHDIEASGVERLVNLATMGYGNLLPLILPELISYGLNNSVLRIYDELVNLCMKASSLDQQLAALDTARHLFGWIHLPTIQDEVSSDEVDNHRAAWWESFMNLFESSGDPEVRSATLRVLMGLSYSIGDRFELLSKALNDPDEEVCLMAARFTYSRENTLPTFLTTQLRGLLDDPSPGMQQLCGYALIRSGDFCDDEIPALLDIVYPRIYETLEQGELQARLQGLIELASKSTSSEHFHAVVDKVRELLDAQPPENDGEGSDANQSRSHYQVITPHPQQMLADNLVSLFDDPDARVRHWAVDLWTWVRPDVVGIAQWLELLTDECSEVQIVAMCSLGLRDLESAEIQDVLVGKLVDPNPDVATFAAGTLSRIVEPATCLDLASRAAGILSQHPENQPALKVLAHIVWGTWPVPMVLPRSESKSKARW